MKYSSGNYEAFSKVPKKEKHENTKAYIVGSGIASLSAAVFLIRDAHLAGKNIHIFEKGKNPGGACGGFKIEDKGYVLEGGRNLDEHFEILWDMLKTIPSVDDDSISVLDETYIANNKDPYECNVRVTGDRAEELITDYKFNLSDGARGEIIRLFLKPDEELFDKKVSEVLSEDVLSSDFWLYWSTSFIFREDMSALEMKRRLQRFLYDVDRITDQKAIKAFKRNPYEAMIVPIIKYLNEHDVNIKYGNAVVDVFFDSESDDEIVAKSITIKTDEEETVIDIDEGDILLITNGSSTENLSIGGQHEKAEIVTELKPDGAWELWRKIAVQDNSFGNPDKLCNQVDSSKLVSATITTKGVSILPYIKSIVRRDPLEGSCVSGGIVSIKDSPWKLSWSFGRQPQFEDQPRDVLVGWMYGLEPENEGTYVKKHMGDCTGKEMCMEWLYHIGVPEENIPAIAEEGANTIPVIIPFMTAFYLPRAEGDKPKVIPDKSKNFGFIGQFARTVRDATLTVEYSVRTAMEAVYSLLDIKRGIPEVWDSTYDLRDILSATTRLFDNEKLIDSSAKRQKRIAREILKLSEGTDAYTLLEETGIL